MNGRPALAEKAMKAWPLSSAQTKNSIGYVEYAYVLQNKYAYGLVQNKAGKFIKPDAAELPGGCVKRGLAQGEGLLSDHD